MNGYPRFAWTDINRFQHLAGADCILPSEASFTFYLARCHLAPCPRNVIPGQDQGSHFNAVINASESTIQVHRLDSWSQPGMTVLLHLQFHIVLLFLYTKVELILSASQMHNIEWTNVRQARLNAHSGIQWNLLFLCSYVFKSGHPLKKHHARETSSLARTRDLILMQSPMSARAQYKSNDQIPGPCQEWRCSSLCNNYYLA